MNKKALICIVVCGLLALLLTAGLVYFLTVPDAAQNVAARFGIDLPAKQQESVPDSSARLDTVPSVSDGDCTIYTAEADAVKIKWSSGEVKILPSDNGRLEFFENAQPQEKYALEAHTEKMGSRTTLVIRDYPRSILDIRLNTTPKLLTLCVPEKMLDSITVDTASADIRLSDLSLPTLDMETASGAVTVTNADVSTLSVETASGEVIAENTTASRLSLDSASGALSAAGSFDFLEVESSSGSVYVKDAAIPKSVDIETASGSVTMWLPAECHEQVAFDTASGELESFLGVTHGDAAYEIETASGNVTICAG